ncbi:MAG: C10 family peptidase [Kiritimatiellae bacterium]|nr:C10 family peptidase [Kiritimatiellia bacterium]
MRRRHRLQPLFFTAAVFAAFGARAASVSADSARQAAREWARVRGSGDSGASYVAADATVRPVVSGGETVAHVVDLAGGGSVLMAADSEQSPVIAFSPSARLSLDEGSPLLALVEKRVARRSAAGFKSRWDSLLSAKAPAAAAAKGIRETSDLIDDVCVAPMLSTKWGQAEVEFYAEADDGEGGSSYVLVTQNVYNVHTPNNWVCGCVATAMAQIMYFNRWPEEPIPQFTSEISVGGAWKRITFPAREPEWTFDWDSMAEIPEESFPEMDEDARTTAADAVGWLTYVCGLSVHMMYTDDESGSYAAHAAAALRDRFGYACARSVASYNGLPYSDMVRTIGSNLDLGLPVLLGISGNMGGHAIVCDGYGYVTDGGKHDPTLYYHLNMGWDGQNDVWYALPAIDVREGAGFSEVDDIVFNIFKEDVYGNGGLDEIFSGRVLGSDGAPVAGLTVKLLATSHSDDAEETSFSTVSSDRGVYAFRVPKQQYCTSSVKFKLSDDSEYGSISESTSATLTGYKETVQLKTPGGCANVWDAELVVDPSGNGTAESIPEAVGNKRLSFRVSGDADWFGCAATGSPYTAEYSAQSGKIGDSGVSSVSTTIDVADTNTVSFAWMTSCESGADHLRVYVDGEEFDRASGATPWTLVEIPLEAGTHVVKWEYAKDESLSKRDDAVWVDAVKLAVGNASDFQIWMEDNFPGDADASNYLDRGRDDDDDDGMSNLEEYIAGTDPNEADDRLRITRIEKGDGTAEIEWAPDGKEGRTYTVQTSPEIGEGASWTDEAAGVASPWTDEAADGDAKFYKIKVEFPVEDYE